MWERQTCICAVKYNKIPYKADSINSLRRMKATADLLDSKIFVYKFLWLPSLFEGVFLALFPNSSELKHHTSVIIKSIDKAPGLIFS
jgi:hypothetical protein